MEARERTGLPAIIHVQGIGTILGFLLPFLMIPMLLLNTVSLLWTCVQLPKSYRFLPVKVLLLQIFFFLVTAFFFLFYLSFTEAAVVP